jgi:hypothetical protein
VSRCSGSPPMAFASGTSTRTAIWRVVPGEWNADALIEFAFEGKQQDIKRFRNALYWKDRFGTLFQWADFYEAVAEKLLPFASDRAPLIHGIHQIAQRVQGLDYLQDMCQTAARSRCKTFAHSQRWVRSTEA